MSAFELSQERYDAVKAARLTRYSREDILAAAKEYETAEAEVCSLSEEGNRQIDAFIANEEKKHGHPVGLIRNQILWTEHLDDQMAEVYDAVCRASDAVRMGRGSGSGEMYPLGIWRKAASSQRAAARRLKTALRATAQSQQEGQVAP